MPGIGESAIILLILLPFVIAGGDPAQSPKAVTSMSGMRRWFDLHHRTRFVKSSG
jgi:hypothetical protein